MKLLEKNDPKEDLRKKTDLHRAELEQEVRILEERTEKALTNVLIIAGALTLSYLIFRKFQSSKSRSKSKRDRLPLTGETEEGEETKSESVFSSVMSDVGAILATQVASFLLEVAKEKLKDYLESQTSKNKEDIDEHS
jgi:FtsZ-interacting cell division protein ZipA